MEDLINARELAKRLMVSEATIRAWTIRSDIPRVKIGRRMVRFRYSDVVSWLQRESGHDSDTKTA